MGRALWRVGLGLGLVGGAALAVVRILTRRPGGPPPGLEGDRVWPPLADVAVAPGPEPSPVRAPGGDETPPVAVEAASPAPALATAWVAPTERACPATHPVKAKVASGIYHLPGMANYARTTPDRCYADAAAAEADGLRPAKR
jgi:hypothetical protein